MCTARKCSHRAKHGALLDSELLAEVYIEMIGGRQAALGLVMTETGGLSIEADDGPIIVMRRERPLQPRLTEIEIAAHAALISKIGAKAIWTKYGG